MLEDEQDESLFIEPPDPDSDSSSQTHVDQPCISVVSLIQSVATTSFPDLDCCEAKMFEAVLEEGFCVVRCRSKPDKKNNVRKVWYSCVHAGSYASKRAYLTEKNRVRKTSTRKSGCEWSAISKRARTAEGWSWSVEVLISVHNHDPSDPTAYHSARQLTTEEKTVVKGMTKSGAAPKIILATLNDARAISGDRKAAVIGQDIYNVKKRQRLEELQGRTPVEALLDQLQEKEIWHQKQTDSEGRITHLIFIPRETSQLLLEYHSVLLMDCTYKTNRYTRNCLL